MTQNMGTCISFEYKNHRGEVAIRKVVPDALEYIKSPGFDYASGWFLSGFDVDKGARRSFALENITIPDQEKFYKLIHFNTIGDSTCT